MVCYQLLKGSMWANWGQQDGRKAQKHILAPPMLKEFQEIRMSSQVPLGKPGFQSVLWHSGNKSKQFLIFLFPLFLNYCKSPPPEAWALYYSLSEQQILLCDCCVGVIVGPGVSQSSQGNNIITAACLVGMDSCMDCTNDQLSVAVPAHVIQNHWHLEFGGTPEMTYFIGFYHVRGVVQALCGVLWTFLLWGG